MADKDPAIDNMNSKSSSFTCGVVEGFYGRPWTTEQRKDLFQKLKKWEMDAYVYAPKDDYKHRAYWRELYTVEEAEHLSGLIAAARENGITFYYALSPGLDIVYSSAKEVSAIKRKLDQVSQFGCSAFALLFDDIEPEMSAADKEVFQSFAHAQVSVSNEVYQHLNQPKFMICPTEYCAARAEPDVSSSEYLNTLGSKLLPEIDIMWTGPMVVSRIMSVESIEEITESLRRPPVLWDNLHANDYDQKRVFLGPYAWRSPDLIRKLRGVMTNPNCEYGANFVPIHTLAQWSRCNVDGKRDLSINDTVSADIKLETETEDGTSGEDIPSNLTPNMYHPRRALNNAINAWIPEFNRQKQAWGPIIKPQPVIPVPIAVPILPSINTCMSLTTTTTTTTSTAGPPVQPLPTTSQAPVVSSLPVPLSIVPPTPPVVNASATQLDNLTEVPLSNESFPVQPVSAPVMNSLVSESKVVAIPPLAQPLPLPLAAVPSIPIPLPLPLPVAASVTSASAPQAASATEPMDCNPTPNGSPAHLGKTAASSTEDVAMIENGMAAVAPPLGSSCSSTMQVEVTDSNSSVHSTPSQMIVEPAGSDEERLEKDGVTYQDLALLCDLFYLPFEHGSSGLLLLQEFNWLKSHAHLVSKSAQANGDVSTSAKKPEVQEWFDRAGKFEELTRSVNRLFVRLSNCPNRELLHELYPYIWDVRGIVSLLNSFVKWLALGNFPTMVGSYTLGSYTWFSKGWKETFMSGEHEPWVFRGGLIADLQRLVPVDSGTDLFVYKIPEVPSSKIYQVRPVLVEDRCAMQNICHAVHASPESNLEFYPDLLTDRFFSFVSVALDVDPCMTLVIHDEEDTVVGFASAALDAKVVDAKIKSEIISEMCAKYPLTGISEASPQVAELVNWFHSFEGNTPESVLSSHPSAMYCALLPTVEDPSAVKRLVICLLAALRANGSFGVHAAVRSNDQASLEMYNKLGFLVLNSSAEGPVSFLGRTF